ncbi:MAG: transketolase [Clostridia bacterium]|nr:transketolase [Clostridia bacterium]
MKCSTELAAAKVRRGIVEAVYRAKSGHPGGSLSIADILSVLYFEEMNIDPKNPKMEGRDRFVLSKGHASPGLYSVLANRGFFPVEDLKTFRKTDSYLQGHPDMLTVPGVEASTGSLGQGISIANGMAMSAKLSGEDYRVYSIIGDGECEEGQVWEAAMFAAHYKLNNHTIFLDFNGLQIDGDIRKVMSPVPLDEKFRAFGLQVLDIDGNDLNQIRDAIKKAKETTDRPTLIMARTVKGKGVSFMENEASWHGNAPNDEQYAQAVSELDAEIARLEGVEA